MIFILEDVKGKLGQRPVSIYCDLVLGQYVLQAPVVQEVDTAIHRINHLPVDNAMGFPNIYQAPVVQTLDSAIQWISIYSVDSAIGFPNTSPLDSDLSDG